MPRLALRFFGGFRADLDGVPLANFRSTRAQALLGYLAVQSERAHSREALATLLWPDEDGATAKQNLRQALYQLRQLLGDLATSYLLSSRDKVQFRLDSHLQLDVTDFLACLSRGELQAAVDIYQGGLLADLAVNSEPFEEWLLLARERFHLLAFEALNQLSRRALAQSDWVAAQTYARRQLALEPWREEAHRQLMQALAASGQRSATLAQYEACCRILAAELGVEPDAETKELVAAIRQGDLSGQRDRADRAIPRNIAKAKSQQDWGEGPDIAQLYGRNEDLAHLTQWIVQDRCRLVAVIGMGGIGKTALTTNLARQIADQFEFVIWRSLVNAPPLTDILHAWATFLSSQQLIRWPDHLDAQLNLVFEYLRRCRCLLVVDNVESIMQENDRAGHYRAGYEDYGQLFKRMGESAHESVMLLTSREQPSEFIRLEADTPLVRTLPLAGLNAVVGTELLAQRGLGSQGESASVLVNRYSGNPLALKLVAETIRDLFDGDISAFLGDELLIYDDIRDVLDQQVARLPPLERDILVCLAIAREPLAEQDLLPLMRYTDTRRGLIEALRSLQRRSLLERSGHEFGLQNVLTEYLTEYVVAAVYDEFRDTTPGFLQSHALVAAHAKEYIRQSQQRMILQPLCDRLVKLLGREEVERRARQLVGLVRRESTGSAGFLPGNVLNVLLQLGTDLTGYNFSGVRVWQAYLRGADLPEVDFSHTDLSGTVFTDYVGAVTSLAVSPDGQLLAAGADNGAVYVWRLISRQLVGVCNGHKVHVWSVAFSPDGCQLASASDDHTVRVWDTATFQTIHILTGHKGGVKSVAFHPNGMVLASGSDDRTARIWNAATGEQLHVLQEHDGMVAGVAFCPRGERLLTGSYDQVARVWDWQQETVLHNLEGHTGPVRAVAYVPCSSQWGQATRAVLATASYDQTLRLWDAETGDWLSSLAGHTAPVLSLAFSADGTLLMSGSDDQTVRVWDVCDADQRVSDHHAGKGRVVGILSGHFGAVSALAVQPRPEGDNVLLISGSHDKTVRLWDVRRGNATAILRGHSKWLQTIVFAPDGRLLVGGSDGQNVRIWDGRTGHVLHTLRGHISLTEKLAFDAQGSRLASASWDKTARIWDVSGGQARHVLQGHTAPVSVAAMGRGPQGVNLIASGSLDETVRIWDGDSGHALACWHGHTDRVVSLAFHPNGRMLASGCWDSTIGLWNIEDGELICFLRGHNTAIECVAFNPEGNMLASGSWDGSVRLWNVAAAETIQVLSAHTSGLEMVAFSPDGRLLASCACDNTVCLWNAHTGRLLCRLQGHGSWVRCIGFGPDSTLLASGSDDGTVRLWDTSPANAGVLVHAVSVQDPYSGLNIIGATGITAAQREVLRSLGAVERSQAKTSPAERSA